MQTKQINLDVKINQYVNSMLYSGLRILPWNAQEEDIKSFYEKFYDKKIILTYSFDKNHYDYSDPEKSRDFFMNEYQYDIFPEDSIFLGNDPKTKLFNKSEKKLARLAMQSWSDVANIEFKNNTDDSIPNISYIVYENNDGRGGQALLPNNRKYTPVYLNRYSRNNEVIKDNSTLYTLMHELGHALGLEHSTHAPVFSIGSKYDSNEPLISILTFSIPQPINGILPATPLMADIVVIQKLYGPNMKTRRGNTVYGFNSNTNRDFYTINDKTQNLNVCVWDAGGEDTFDFSGYDENQLIDLNEKSFSSVGKLKENISIAPNVIIENAIGGNGDDIIIGNSANNKLTGAGGADKLTSGAGKDIFVYQNINDSTWSDTDIITDFESGIDKIDVSNLILNENELHFVNECERCLDDECSDNGRATLLQTYHDVEDLTYLIIDFDGKGEGEDMIIKLVGKHQFSTNDFIFANPLSLVS